MEKETKDLIENLQFGEYVYEIIQAYKDGSKEPLDGDETERLAHIILAEMDLIEGNITRDEYEERLELPKPLVRCPNDPNHKEFITTVHQVHDWVVDQQGNFIEDLGCSEVATFPDINNIWFCKQCGAIAKVL